MASSDQPASAGFLSLPADNCRQDQGDRGAPSDSDAKSCIGTLTRTNRPNLGKVALGCICQADGLRAANSALPRSIMQSVLNSLIRPAATLARPLSMSALREVISSCVAQQATRVINSSYRGARPGSIFGRFPRYYPHTFQIHTTTTPNCWLAKRSERRCQP